jgi:hypothetical protein
MQFGIDIDSLDRAQKSGLDFSFGTVWAGGWTQKHGWNDIEAKLRTAKKHGVTPVVSWWYWGDDISPSCLANGCRDRYHGVQKDAQTWYRLSDQLSALVAKTMGDQDVYVVLETEFNKAGVERYEPFDAQLVEVMSILRKRGRVKVVLAFGNWGREHWSRFDRAIASADFIGTQLLQSSIRDTATYDRAVSTLVDAARFIQRRFAKPSLVADLAMSSYPSSSYESHQAAFVRELNTRMPELKSAGVHAILYRMIADDPSFDTRNYHGVAERHWGLLRADGSRKPAYAPFAAMVRGEPSPAPAAR